MRCRIEGASKVGESRGHEGASGDAPVTGLTEVAFNDCVNPVETWNPSKTAGEEEFLYIDLSAIDQERKQIAEARSVSCAEAPSRARQLVEKGDVLVSTVRPNLNGVARVGVGHHGATASTGFCVLRPAAGKLDGGYAFQWVKSPAFVNDMVSMATGASYPAVSDRIVLESKIPLPPLPEQRRIAAILDQADALRAKRREALAQLDSLTQSIFVEMFGDPVKNPMGWECRTLDQLTTKVTDGEPLNPKLSESGMPIVMAVNVLEDRIALEKAKRVDYSLGQQFRKKCGPEVGDLFIVGRGATIGRLCRINQSDVFCLMGSVILLKPDRDVLDERFLSGMLALPSMHAMLYKTSGSSAQQAIYLKDVKKLICPLPPLPLQQTFATRIQAVESLKATHRAALTESNALFASLQHRAFAGQL